MFIFQILFLCRFNIWLFVCLESRWHFHFCTSIGRRLAFPVGCVRQKVQRSRVISRQKLVISYDQTFASGVQTMHFLFLDVVLPGFKPWYFRLPDLTLPAARRVHGRADRAAPIPGKILHIGKGTLEKIVL